MLDAGLQAVGCSLSQRMVFTVSWLPDGNSLTSTDMLDRAWNHRSKSGVTSSIQLCFSLVYRNVNWMSDGMPFCPLPLGPPFGKRKEMAEKIRKPISIPTRSMMYPCFGNNLNRFFRGPWFNLCSAFQ